MITVHPIDKPFHVTCKVGKTKVKFTFRQLNYFQNSQIMTECLIVRSGQNVIDQSKRAFMTLQYALTDVEGFKGPGGKPYELEFEPVGEDDKIITENCINQLLSTPVTDVLLLVGSNLGQVVPKQILDPLTKKKVDGIEVIQPNAKQLAKKK